MRVFVTGATGLVGRALCDELLRRGDEVVALSRKSQRSVHGSLRWVVGDPGVSGPWTNEVEGTCAVVHLAGESIASGRWTRARKDRMVASRVTSTRLVSQAIAACANPPRVLVTASATGYYGFRGEEPLSEDASPGDDFLARLCCAWEAAALEAARDPLRVVCMRFGVVLSASGGALPKLFLPFRLGLGGPLGPSDRWFPWIHERDAVGLVLHALRGDAPDPVRDAPVLRGPVNAVAPGVVRMGEFASALGAVLRRPAWLPVPMGLLRIPLGELADMLSPGQRVECGQAIASGYRFSYPDLDSAFRACLA